MQSFTQPFTSLCVHSLYKMYAWKLLTINTPKEQFNTLITFVNVTKYKLVCLLLQIFSTRPAHDNNANSNWPYLDTFSSKWNKVFTYVKIKEAIIYFTFNKRADFIFTIFRSNFQNWKNKHIGDFEAGRCYTAKCHYLYLWFKIWSAL